MKKFFQLVTAGMMGLALSIPDQHCDAAALQDTNDRGIRERADSVSVQRSLYPVNQRKFFKGRTSHESKIEENSIVSGISPVSISEEQFVANQPIEMIAIGGGLVAGVRNGGLYRFGQLTAFPNILAGKLAVKNFNSPLFDVSEANGTGFVLDEGEGEFPEFLEVTNGLATLKQAKVPQFSRFDGLPVRNFGIPHGDLVVAKTAICNADCGVYQDGKTWAFGQVFGARILPTGIDETTTSLLDHALSKKYSFFLLEDGFDELIDLVKENTHLESYGYDKANTAELSMLKRVIEKMKKLSPDSRGVVFTIPMVTDLPYLNWYSGADLVKKAKSVEISYSRNQARFRLGKNSNFYFLPTESVDSLFRNFKGGEVVANLKNADIMDAHEIYMTTTTIKLFNTCIRKWAKLHNLALVDLEDIYHQINANSYAGESRLQIRGGRKGNFFSSDGIYPSALGHAVLANEVIKSINATYNTSISPIDLVKYEKLVSKQ